MKPLKYNPLGRELCQYFVRKASNTLLSTLLRMGRKTLCLVPSIPNFLLSSKITEDLHAVIVSEM